MAETHTFIVEVAYALHNRQKIIQCDVVSGTTIFEAALAAGMEVYFPELVVAESKMGIFGKVVSKPKLQAVREGDRIEIYRPLIIDPKEVRKARAAKVKAAKAEAKD